MAGTDYSGFAINFETKTWTNMGYVYDGKKVISFHKQCDDSCTIELAPTDEQPLGIARYKDWWMVYGYAIESPSDFLLQYLKKNKHTKESNLVARIIKKRQTMESNLKRR